MDFKQGSGITRRDALVGATMLGVGAGLDHLLARPDSASHGGESASATKRAVPFFGARQEGIATPAQEFLDFVAFDLTSGSADDLRDVLKQWTAAAAALTAGRPYEPSSEKPDVAPTDPGEAIGV